MASRTARAAVILFGLANLALALGFNLRQGWAISLWPWPLRPLDSILLSSFLASASAVILWLGGTSEWGAAAGATMNVGLMDAGAAVYLFCAWRDAGAPGLLDRAAVFALFAILNAVALVWSVRHPIRDARPMKTPLRVCFALFSGVLLFAAIQLLRRAPTIFPWALRPENSTMYGLLFLGSFVYFLYGFLRPSWHNARGQLLAFLVYDLVLIPPYAKHFEHVAPAHLTSLRIYMAVMLFSAFVAVYYLFVDATTRPWFSEPSQATDSLAALPQ
jgi:hypothetical protein